MSQKLLNRILKGEFKTIEDLKYEILNESEPKTYTIFTYRVKDPEMEEYFDVVDCIFLNDENENDDHSIFSRTGY